MRKSGDRELELVPSANRSGDGGGTAYEQPTESTHCLNLGTRREEDQRAAEDDRKKNCRRREAEHGFRHLERSCYQCKRQRRLEKTSQRPYSLRGESVSQNPVGKTNRKSEGGQARLSFPVKTAN